MEPEMEPQQPGDGWDYDYVDDEAANLGGPPPAALPTPGRERGGWFLLILGTVFVAAGVLPALPPQISSHLAGFGEMLRSQGLDTGVLVLGGLIFWSMASVQHSTRRSALAAGTTRIERAGSELLLATDQIVTDLEQILTAVLRTNDDLSAVTDSQRILVKELLDDKEPTEKEHTALFRLAASLDALNARVDTRLHEFDTQFRSRFESVSAAVHEARLSLETRVDSLLPSPPSISPSSPSGAAPALEIFDQIEERPVPEPMAPEEPDPALPAELEMQALDALLPDDDPRG